MRAPILLVMAGPNGSGKSTVTARVHPVGEYVNADEIQRHLNCTPLEAAQIAEATRETLLEKNQDFTFETVLSTERNYSLMERAHNKGYRVICIFMLTVNPQINIDRVQSRMAGGGNPAPLEKIAGRYCRALRLFPKLFKICDELYVYDNSADRSEGEPHRILTFMSNRIHLYPTEIWSIPMLQRLVDGEYAVPFETQAP